MNIKEASQLTGTTADTIRYYEKTGLIPAIGRTAGGIRDFDDKDIRSIKFAITMRKAGLPVDTLKQYISLLQQGDASITERKAILNEQVEALRQNIAELTETLNYLEYKVEHYEDHLRPFESNLRQDNYTLNSSSVQK